MYCNKMRFTLIWFQVFFVLLHYKLKNKVLFLPVLTICCVLEPFFLYLKYTGKKNIGVEILFTEKLFGNLLIY